jgi:hypothetical protein
LLAPSSSQFDPDQTVIGLSPALAPRQLPPPNLFAFLDDCGPAATRIGIFWHTAYCADFVLPTNFTILQSCIVESGRLAWQSSAFLPQ